MKKLYWLVFLLQGSFLVVKAQPVVDKNLAAKAWADSVYNSLNPDQRIAQLMVLRLSAYDFKNKTPIYYDSAVAEAVKKYNVGGICPFQG
ncbi:MAG: hypothetical protein ABIU77_02000, partial [Ferruginibacter sp.]